MGISRAEKTFLDDVVNAIVKFSEDKPEFSHCGLYLCGGVLRKNKTKDIDLVLVGLDF